jgi:hypothetical protein
MAGGCAESQIAGDTTRGPSVATVDRETEHRIDGKPVSATLRLSRTEAKIGESIEVMVQLDVAAMWEIRPFDAHPEIAATRLELRLPDGLQSEGGWGAPEPIRSVAADGHPAYSGKVVFTRSAVVTGSATGGENSVRCRVTYQACNERQCLPPTAVELSVPVRIEK